MGNELDDQQLFNRKGLARVSAVPGKTATINFFHADGIRFADLPGYGYAKVSKGEKRRWAELIEGYFAQERDLRVVFQLHRHAPSADGGRPDDDRLFDRPGAAFRGRADQGG